MNSLVMTCGHCIASLLCLVPRFARVIFQMCVSEAGLVSLTEAWSSSLTHTCSESHH